MFTAAGATGGPAGSLGSSCCMGLSGHRCTLWHNGLVVSASGLTHLPSFQLPRQEKGTWESVFRESRGSTALCSCLTDSPTKDSRVAGRAIPTPTPQRLPRPPASTGEQFTPFPRTPAPHLFCTLGSITSASASLCSSIPLGTCPNGAENLQAFCKEGMDKPQEGAMSSWGSCWVLHTEPFQRGLPGWGMQFLGFPG